MPKAIIVTDIKHKQLGQAQQLRDLLKHLQFRDGSVQGVVSESMRRAAAILCYADR